MLKNEHSLSDLAVSPITLRPQPHDAFKPLRWEKAENRTRGVHTAWHATRCFSPSILTFQFFTPALIDQIVLSTRRNRICSIHASCDFRVRLHMPLRCRFECFLRNYETASSPPWEGSRLLTVISSQSTVAPAIFFVVDAHAVKIKIKMWRLLGLMSTSGERQVGEKHRVACHGVCTHCCPHILFGILVEWSFVLFLFREVDSMLANRVQFLYSFSYMVSLLSIIVTRFALWLLVMVVIIFCVSHNAPLYRHENAHDSYSHIIEKQHRIRKTL